MSPHERLLRALLDVVVVRPGGGWSWFGRRVDPMPRETGDSSVHRSAEVVHLRDRLYGCFYVYGAPVPVRGEIHFDFREPGTIAGPLAAVGEERLSRQPGWTVVSVSDGTLVLEHDGITAWATEDQVIVPPGDGPVVGRSVEALVPSVIEGALPGFVLVLGDRTLSDGAEETVDRYYWHVRASGAIRLASELSEALNRSSIPFRFKTLAAPGSYVRCDAAVLYARRADREQVVAVARRVRSRLASGLRSATPALTLRLADGLALAEEPPRAASFGAHRCGLLADALISAAERGFTDADARLAHLRDHFAREGIDLDAPWRLGPRPT